MSAVKHLSRNGKRHWRFKVYGWGSALSGDSVNIRGTIPETGESNLSIRTARIVAANHLYEEVCKTANSMNVYADSSSRYGFIGIGK